MHLNVLKSVLSFTATQFSSIPPASVCLVRFFDIKKLGHDALMLWNSMIT